MIDTEKMPVFDTGQRALRFLLMRRRITAILSDTYEKSPASVDRQVTDQIMDAIDAEEWGPLA